MLRVTWLSLLNHQTRASVPLLTMSGRIDGGAPGLDVTASMVCITNTADRSKTVLTTAEPTIGARAGPGGQQNGVVHRLGERGSGPRRRPGWEPGSIGG